MTRTAAIRTARPCSPRRPTRPDGVQAVSIATPNGMHYEVCKAALEAGLHVVCEKPLCFTSEQADELVKLAGGESTALSA